LELWKSCLVLFQAALGKAAQRIAFSIAAAASTTLPAPDHPLQSRNSQENEDDTAESYIKRIQDLIKDKGAKARFYDTAKKAKAKNESESDPFAFDILEWNDQFIASFIDGLFDVSVTLTPEETFLAYSEGGLPFLQLDLDMLDEFYEPQENDGMIHSTPEPSVLALLGVGAAWLAVSRSRTRHR